MLLFTILSSESKTVTMDEEVQLFTRRIIKLESLLKELYMKCASSEEGNVLLELMTKCSAILGNVENDKSLSAGGRFEWVDSVLVKVSCQVGLNLTSTHYVLFY